MPETNRKPLRQRTIAVPHIFQKFNKTYENGHARVILKKGEDVTSSIKRSFSPSRVIALLGATGLLVGSIGLGGGTCFLNIPSFLITFGFAFFLLLGTFGTDYLKFIPDSLLTLVSTPSEPIPRYADICRFGSRYAIAGAVIGTLIGFIQMLTNLDDPDSIAIGMAISLLPTLYALFLAEVIFALLYKAYSDGAEPKATPPLSYITIAIVMVVLGLLMTTFLALLIALTNFE